MQSLVFSPRTHCKVPLIFSAVALPDKSRHFCSSASEITHQETEEKVTIEAKKNVMYSRRTYASNIQHASKTEPHVGVVFLCVPVVFGLETQLTDRRCRTRTRNGSFLCGRSMSTVVGHLLGTPSLLRQKWLTGRF